MSECNFTVIIPARYASSRLPGKPLQDIHGKTMVQRVYEAACLSLASKVVIATDDQRIFDEASRFGAQVCMTRVDHESGTDRLQEVVEQLGLADDDIVVNVQGDEPLIPPSVINQVAELLASKQEADIATLCEPITSVSTVIDPNVVKVVRANNKMALYFSRAPIPWDRDKSGFHSIYRRHIGIYAYRVHLLNNFVQWPAGELEMVEKLEQLRAMEKGSRIVVDDAVQAVPGGIDTPADLEAVRQLLG
jgi:3-deoxy-manno-octulosonate cytidylyltransferase (CMP-KDO synthetase)